MNTKDKERVRRAKSASVGEDAASTGADNVQEKLKSVADQAAPILADNMAAQTLVSALALMQQGYCGPKTTAILEAIQQGTVSPLEEWGNQILPWTQPALLSSTVESTG